MPGKIRNSVDSLMNSYGAVVMVNCVGPYHFFNRLPREAIKFCYPILFLYARRFIQSKDDLIFILYTFPAFLFYSSLQFLGNELVFGPYSFNLFIRRKGRRIKNSRTVRRYHELLLGIYHRRIHDIYIPVY